MGVEPFFVTHQWARSFVKQGEELKSLIVGRISAAVPVISPVFARIAWPTWGELADGNCASRRRNTRSAAAVGWRRDELTLA